jgi:hypothetical protein
MIVGRFGVRPLAISVFRINGTGTGVKRQANSGYYVVQVQGIV